MSEIEKIYSATVMVTQNLKYADCKEMKKSLCDSHKRLLIEMSHENWHRYEKIIKHHRRRNVYALRQF